MLRYKAGYKSVEGGVHAQVVDFPASQLNARHYPCDSERRSITGISRFLWIRRLICDSLSLVQASRCEPHGPVGTIRLSRIL